MKNKIWWIIGAIVLVLVIFGAFYFVNIVNELYPPLIKSSEFENMFYQVSPCNQEDKEIFVNITVNLDSIMLRQKASYVCCADIKLRYEIENTTLKIYEDNVGKICKCICYYPIIATINEPNITQVEVYGIYYPEVHPYELLGEQTIIQTQKNMACISEGKGRMPGDLKCCSGLEELNVYGEVNGILDCSVAVVSAKICSDCGNNLCDSGENKCNCPEDCS